MTVEVSLLSFASTLSQRNVMENLVVVAQAGSERTRLLECTLKHVYQSQLKALMVIYLVQNNVTCLERAKSWGGQLREIGVTIFSDLQSVKALDKSTILIVTPESLDRWTRDADSAAMLASKLDLVVVDDLDSLGDPKGWILELVVCRMAILKGRLDLTLRIIGMSAGVADLEALVSWMTSLGRKGGILDLSFMPRSVPLTRYVISYDATGQSPFLFEKSLDKHLLALFRQFGLAESIIILCSTRKSSESTAKFLAQALLVASLNFERGFDDAHLQELVEKRIAYHNAGLSPEDRRLVERMFTEGQVHILCATNSVSSGATLAARAVIIKGTKKYTGTGFEDYSAMEVQQLLERAGRAGLDTTGLGIILTSNDRRSKYEAEPGRSTVFSQLLTKMAECICSEIAAGVIDSRNTARSWLQTTFWGVVNEGFQKNHLESQIKRLVRLGIIRDDKESLSLKGQCSTFPKYCLSITCMERLLKAESLMTHEALLQTACKALDSHDCRLSQGDKGVLNRLARHPRIRFPLGGKIDQAWQKAFIAVQVCLCRDDSIKINYATRREFNKIHDKIKSVMAALIQLAECRKDALGIRNTIELAGAIRGGVWHEGSLPLQMIDGIGSAYAKLLEESGITRISELQNADPHKLETILKRITPFGLNLLAASRRFPIMSLETDSCMVGVKLSIYFKCCSQDGELSGGKGLHVLAIWARGDQSKLLFSAKDTSSVEQTIEIDDWHSEDQVSISFMSSLHAGVNLCRIIRKEVLIKASPTSGENEKIPLSANSQGDAHKEKGPAPRSASNEQVRAMGNGLIVPGITPELDLDRDYRLVGGNAQGAPLGKKRKALKSGGREDNNTTCNHNCRNKHLCKHKCCKYGLESVATAKSIELGMTMIKSREKKTFIPIINTFEARKAPKESFTKSTTRFSHIPVSAACSWSFNDRLSFSSSSSSEIEYVVTEGTSPHKAFSRFMKSLGRT